MSIKWIPVLPAVLVFGCSAGTNDASPEDRPDASSYISAQDASQTQDGYTSEVRSDSGTGSADSDSALAEAATDSPSAGGADASSQANSPRQLDIPPRRQWENANGYCGETSVQSIGLYYGAWISQQLVRDLAGGELLLGVNETAALDELKFGYELWDSNESSPQGERFMVWLKESISQGSPCIIAVYLSDGSDGDYDHIIPATGIQYASLSTFDPNDEITVNDLFGTRVARKAGTYAATRSSCSYDSDLSGCIPHNVDYGVAVTGIRDDDNVTLPVSLSVADDSEPNVSQGETPSQMAGTVTVSGLQSGSAYVLLRYDDYRDVPTSGAASAYLSSKYFSKIEFTATSDRWTYEDPARFPSDGSTYYRAVRK